jgi:hypothetical protein
MAQVPRWLLSLVVAFLAFIGLVRYENWPAETYTPPPMLYQNATAKATGYITGNDVKYLSDHLLEGSDQFYYEKYEFSPHIHVVDKHGKTHVEISPTKYDGEVRIEDWGNTPPVAGSEIEVNYDPIDPHINGVPGTLGVWSKTTGYLNPYLWYYIGILVFAFVLQETIRILTRTNDLG